MIPLEEWREQAECRSHPTRWFFPEQGETPRRAIAICNRCPVIVECREHGRRHESYGVWGGEMQGGRSAWHR
jgi:WhiB family redox-sensing transcriptional regulator